MLQLFPRNPVPARTISRRQWLAMSALAGAGLTRLAHADSESARSHPASAKRCIYIFLCGGPSQPDLWDMKLDAPAGIRSTFKPIDTSVPGIQFSELLPQVARQADKLAIIRSLTHSDNGHVGAIVRTLLGQLPPRQGDYYVGRGDHPGLGGILHQRFGGCGTLPAWLVLPRYFGTYSPPYKGQSGGFLGPAFDPVLFDKPRRNSLSEDPLRLDAVELPEGVNEQRLFDRASLRTTFGTSVKVAAADRFDALYDRTLSLLSSPQTREAFDLESEPTKVRDRYGRNEYGQSFLMARRLIEAGVRFVNVFWTFFDAKGCQFNLWDNHGVANDVCGVDGQLTGLQQLTHDYCTPSFDRSFSALLEDLDQRGLLDDTLVAVAGEFGRTPKINQNSGRDHWAHCYTQLLAGGGVCGGQVYGASDAHGAYVKDSPVSPDDFAATVLHAFGLAPETAIEDQFGRPVRITSGRPVTALFG